MKLRYPTAVIALSLATAACGDDGSGPDDDDEFPSGSVTFAYAGPANANFSVSGSIRFDTNGDPIAVDWAAAARITNIQNAYVVAAFNQTSGERGDLFAIGFEGLTAARTWTFDETCDDTTQCPVPFFILDTTLDETDTDFDWFCAMDTGTVAVTQITAERIRGTFSGSGTCFDDGFNIEPLTVTGGTFDVPIVEEFELDPDDFE